MNICGLRYIQSSLHKMAGKKNVEETEKDPLNPKHITYRGSLNTRILVGLKIIVILASFGVAVFYIQKAVKESKEESVCSATSGRDTRSTDGDRDPFVYTEAAVAADHEKCSEIGRDILIKNGSAMDAAIAGLLCVGLCNPQSSGIGGGSFILYYDRRSASAYSWDAREVAPSAATRTMFDDKPADATKFGGLATAVPGEVSGYWTAHSKFGKLPWKDLFTETINLAETGFPVGKTLAYVIDEESVKRAIRKYPKLREILMDGDGNPLKEGDTMYRRKLAKTLQQIADGNANTFYKGQMAEDIASDIHAYGGIITVEDLANYRVEARTPLTFDLENMTAYSGSAPVSGAVFALVMNILKGYNFSHTSCPTNTENILRYHHIIEAFKFAYAKRTGLGDPQSEAVPKLEAEMISQSYADGLRARIDDATTHDPSYYDPVYSIQEDAGTTHISVVDRDGNAAAVTNSINDYFGSKVWGDKTGIFFNNQMADFVTRGKEFPGDHPNLIRPGYRPLSAMAPAIFVDGDDNVQFVLGGSGGIRIPTAVSLVTINNILFQNDLEESIEKKRVHHQLYPNKVYYEKGFPKKILTGLERKKHKVEESNTSSVVQAIRRLSDGKLEAHCDSRKGGLPAGY